MFLFSLYGYNLINICCCCCCYGDATVKRV